MFANERFDHVLLMLAERDPILRAATQTQHETGARLVYLYSAWLMAIGSLSEAVLVVSCSRRQPSKTAGIHKTMPQKQKNLL